MKIIHKPGNTLHNADGLSRCATAGDSEEDMAIQLDKLETLEEQYLDDIELMQMETNPNDSIASKVNEVNVMA